MPTTPRRLGPSCLMLALLGVGVGALPGQAGTHPLSISKESSKTVREVVRKVLPAVVSVTATAEPTDVADGEEEAPAGAPHGFEVPPFAREGFGSGVIVDPKGVVLTNNHVVARATVVRVLLQDGRSYESSDIRRDPKTDLAIVQIAPEDGETLPHARLGDSGGLEIGDFILAMGSPFGLNGTVTSGIISAKSRPLGLSMYEDFLQTDAAVNPGNSGGPMVNLDGEIVGINTAIRSNSGSFGGIAFAIPSNMARKVVPDLLDHGRVRRGYLGVAMDRVGPERLKEHGAKGGVIITGLAQGETPAREAGIKLHDIIIEAAGEPLADTRALQRVVSDAKPGSEIPMRILRDGESIDVVAVIKEQPEEFGLRRGFARQLRPKRNLKPDSMEVEQHEIAAGGFSVVELTPEAAKRFGLGDEGGIVVSEVDEGSPAARAGLLPGLVIVEIEKQAVTNVEEALKVVGKAELEEGILVKVRRPDGQTRLVVLQGD
ncbi:Periplasmic serine endoprotease DegP precursor [Planctomycetes bacterium Pan216]|uniref:Periplasmic serine endoprotease DegP n=1 Tax=Kolteria novifilia TaxID=2527975 RepID=A0A518AXN8_9BACT|nr:Periplasmic serine endoprotease DegP precursor [Planctomycetes bacterium Pan216]